MNRLQWNRLFSRPRLLFLLAVLLISLIGFEEVYDDVFRDPLIGDTDAMAFDSFVSQTVQSYRGPMFNRVMTDLTSLGSMSVVLTLFFLLASVLLSFRDWRGVSYLTLVLIGAGAWPYFLKPIFGRERPDAADRLIEVTHLSFPSGHSFGATAVYFALSYMAGQYAKTWRQEIFFYILGGTLILTVGLTRIFLGVHFPTDVLGGLCGGAAWAALVSAGFEARNPTVRWWNRYTLRETQTSS